MKKIFAWIGLPCVLLIHSCSGDGLIDSGGRHSSELNITVSLDKLGSETATRASVSPEEGEETVNSLYLYFFEASDSQAGKFVDYIEVPGPLAMDSKYTVQTAGTAISVPNAYNIIAIANIDNNHYISGNADAWSAQWSGKTEAYFRANALAEISGVSSETNNSKAIANDWILMNGTTTKKAMSGEISVTLVRDVARFDVINSVNTEYDLLNVSIWNAYARSSITGDGVLEYSMTPGLRTERFYGLANDENHSTNGSGIDIYGDIKGGLYAFENRVTAPAADDRYTTCLIICLRNKTTDRVGYYRVNVRPTESAQNLKRNHVYKVTLTGVTGNGADTEADAYAGTKNELDYVINYWDLDDNGLIVSDQHSILAVPVKTVRIGVEGGSFSYPITTFSTLAAPSPLSIKSQTYDPATGKINASLSGATVTIEAQPLTPGEKIRTGIVTVTFAGLEASINVIQSASADTYLNVTLEDPWVPTLGSMAGLSTEHIYVKASGPWTAELFGADGFSFSFDTSGPAKTTLTSAEASSGKFHVYTHSQNDEGNIRKAFVIISLDEDPVNYVSVVTICQKPLGEINISPDADAITFNGSKAITSHLSNAFTVSCVVGAIDGYSLSGTNPDKFTVDLPTGSSSATMTVIAKELNTSGDAYTATLRITDGTGAEKLITLCQNSLFINIIPNPPGTVAVTGGQTDLITILTGDASSQWTATIGTASTSAGKTLYNHEAYFVDENGSPLDASIPRSVAKKFRVVFPKVYFPNREINISATITVHIVGSNLSGTVNISQAALIAKPVSIWNSSSGWGALNSGYITGYSDAVSALGYSWTNAGNTNGSAVPPAATTYIHTANNTLGTNFNWTNIETFRTEKDGILFLACDDNNTTPLGVLNKSTSPLNKNGYVVTGTNRTGSGDNIPLHPDLGNTRIGQFLTTRGVTPINPDQVANFYTDGTQTALTAYPATAIPIMVRSNNSNVMMAIDPANRLVYLGESQVFENNNTNRVSGNRGTFRDNFVQYVIYTCKYGSHFTDMLRDDLTNIPPMWGDVWGTNKWPDNK